MLKHMKKAQRHRKSYSFVKIMQTHTQTNKCINKVKESNEKLNNIYHVNLEQHSTTHHNLGTQNFHFDYLICQYWEY